MLCSMSGPPPQVLMGLMRGGALDGCMVEIASGDEELVFSEWPVLGLSTAAELPDLPTYRYTGEVDAQGHALYEPAD